MNKHQGGGFPPHYWNDGTRWPGGECDGWGGTEDPGHSAVDWKRDANVTGSVLECVDDSNEPGWRAPPRHAPGPRASDNLEMVLGQGFL